jgi:hypothetical protein
MMQRVTGRQPSNRSSLHANVALGVWRLRVDQRLRPTGRLSVKLRTHSDAYHKSFQTSWSKSLTIRPIVCKNIAAGNPSVIR